MDNLARAAARQQRHQLLQQRHAASPMTGELGQPELQLGVAGSDGGLTVLTGPVGRPPVVVMSPRLPVTVTMLSREVTVAMPPREPLVLTVRTGSPPAFWRPSFGVLTTAGGWR